MIWIPLVSISIFFFIFISMIFFGYKKGWYFSLFLSIVLIFMTLIFIGINIGIYKILLWPTYKKFFLKNISNKINIYFIRNYYRPYIIVLLLLPEMFFIYPLSFLISYFLNKLLIKKIGHKVGKIVENVSNYKKKILFRKKSIFFKLSGVSILAITSIFSSSLVASSVNAFTIPYKKSKKFNQIMDTLGYIYTFGLAKNSKNNQIITYFLNNKLNTQMIESIIETQNFIIKDKGDITLPQIDKLNYLKSSHTKELFSSGEATNVIFNSIIKNKNPKIKNKNPKINILLLDKKTFLLNTDENDNKIGYGKKFESISNVSQDDNNNHLSSYGLQLEKSIKDYIKQNSYSHLPQVTKNFIFNLILNSIKKFKSTIFYENYYKNFSFWQRSKNDFEKKRKEIDKLEIQKKQIENLIQEKNNPLSSSELIKEKKEYISQIENIKRDIQSKNKELEGFDKIIKIKQQKNIQLEKIKNNKLEIFNKKLLYFKKLMKKLFK